MRISRKNAGRVPEWIDPQTGAVSFSSQKVLNPSMSFSEFVRTPLGLQAVLAREDRNTETFHHLGAFAYQKGFLKEFDLGKHLVGRKTFSVRAAFLNNHLFQVTMHPEGPWFGATEKIKMQKLEEWLNSLAGAQWPSWNWPWGSFSLNSNYDPRLNEKIYATLDIRWGRLNRPGKPWRHAPYVLAVAVEKRPDQKLTHRLLASKRKLSLQWITDDSDSYQALINAKCPHKQIEHFSVRVGLTSPAFLPKMKEFKKAKYLIILSLSAYHCGPQHDLVDEFAKRLIKSCKGAIYDPASINPAKPRSAIRTRNAVSKSKPNRRPGSRR